MYWAWETTATLRLLGGARGAGGLFDIDCMFAFWQLKFFFFFSFFCCK